MFASVFPNSDGYPHSGFLYMKIPILKVGATTRDGKAEEKYGVKVTSSYTKGPVAPFNS